MTDRCAAVYVAGELDLGTAEQLVQIVRMCLAHHPDLLRVDVSELSFCDWYGLKTLLALNLEARRYGTVLTLSGAVRPQLARLIAATGASDVLPVSGVRATGVSACGPALRGPCPAPASPPTAPNCASNPPSDRRPAALPARAVA
nr:STAS domain-containing protein [Streptomyces mexicanus]